MGSGDLTATLADATLTATGLSWQPTFLLRDEFTTPATAPLTSPRTAEPGPGTLTLVQNDGQYSISGGKMSMPIQATPVWGDQGLYWPDSFVARAGLAQILQFNISVASETLQAWRTIANTDYHNQRSDGSGIYLYQSLFRILTIGGVNVSLGIAVALGTDYVAVSVLRSVGNFVFLKGGVFASWTLVWVVWSGSSSPVYATLANMTSAGTLDKFRVLDLPAPYASDFGLATTRLAGARAGGDVFVHQANCVLEWTTTTVGSGGVQRMYFRMQDSSNAWYTQMNVGGAYALFELVAGSPTQRATASPAISNGHRMVIVADGPTISGYVNNLLQWTYSSASNFQSATSGQLVALPTGGVVSDIVSWPRQLSANAAAILDAATIPYSAGQLASTLAAATLAATAQLAIAGQLASTLADVTLAAVGLRGITAQLAVTLADATTVSSAKLAITAQMAAQLGAALLASAGRLSIRAQLSITLGAATLSAGDHPIAIELGVVYGQAGSGFVFGQQGSGEVIGI